MEKCTQTPETPSSNKLIFDFLRLAAEIIAASQSAVWTLFTTPDGLALPPLARELESWDEQTEKVSSLTSMMSSLSVSVFVTATAAPQLNGVFARNDHVTKKPAESYEYVNIELAVVG